MRHGSLFSGIGGFDYAAELMGWENVFHCEWEDFPRKVLKYYWPKAISYGDITKTDFTIHRGRIDILTGGFPCQPYSMAGKRKGKDDSRHLWPHMLRAIREIAPTYIVGENVSGLLNWNDGMVFDEIHADLEAEGYEVQSFVLPAVSVGAPHRRDRVWIVAHAINGRHNTQRGETHKKNGIPCKCGQAMDAGQFNRTSVSSVTPDPDSNDGRHLCRQKTSDRGSTKTHSRVTHNGCNGDVADTTRSSSTGKLFQRQRQGESGGCDCEVITDPDQYERHEGRMHQARPEKAKRHTGTRDAQSDRCGAWDNFPTQSPVCNRDDGLSRELAGITFPKWRNESIKAMGNAIVPQVALQIFKAIEQI